MAIESVVGSVKSLDSTEGISKATGVSAEATRGVLDAALPLLLGGALGQSNNSGTSAGFANALTQHAASNTSNVGAYMSGVDLKDGEKIVNHLFGENANEIITQIAKKSGVKKADVKKVLSAAAPYLMSLLGKEVGAQQQQQQANSAAGVAGIMGSLLGGGGNGTASLLTGLLGASGGANANANANANASNNGSGGLTSLLMGLLR